MSGLSIGVDHRRRDVDHRRIRVNAVPIDRTIMGTPAIIPRVDGRMVPTVPVSAPVWVSGSGRGGRENEASAQRRDGDTAEDEVCRHLTLLKPAVGAGTIPAYRRRESVYRRFRRVSR